MCEHTYHQADRPRPTKYSVAPASHGAGYALFIATSAIMAILFCIGPTTVRAECQSLNSCCEECPNAAKSLVVRYVGPVEGTTRHSFIVSASVSGMSTASQALTGEVTLVEGGYISGNNPKAIGVHAVSGVLCTKASITNVPFQVDYMHDTLLFKLTAKTGNFCTGTTCYCMVIVSDLIDLPDAPDFGNMICEVEVNDPINAINGNLYLERTDVVIESDIGSPIVFSRHYNSQEVDTTRRWRHSYQYELYEWWRHVYILGPLQFLVIGDVVLVEGDGKTTRFFSAGTEGIVQGEGTVYQPTFWSYETGYRLEYDLDTEEYTVVTDNGTKLAFEGTGGGTSVHRLTEMTDRLGNTQTMTWDNQRLEKIDAGNGKELNLDYDPVGGEYVIDKLLDSAQNMLASYFYHHHNNADSIAVLDSVYYADGSWEKYTPARNEANTIGNYEIEKTETSDGATWEYAYTGPDTYRQVVGAFNDDDPVVEYVTLAYSDSIEFSVDTVVVETDSTFDTTIANLYRTTVTNNQEVSQQTTYNIRQPRYSNQRDLIEIMDNSCGGCPTQFGYDWRGQKELVEYANGRVDRMRYDERGNMDTLIRDSGTDDSIMTTYEYHDMFNLVTKITSPSVALPDSSKRIELFRDLVTGNTDSTIESGWHYNHADSNYACTTRFSYNDDEQLEVIDGPRPADSVLDTVGFFYNATTKDLDSINYPYGNTMEFGPLTGLPGSYPWIEDANGVRTSYFYDTRGRIDSVKENSLASAANQKVTHFDFNFKGDITQLTQPLGNAYTFGYDQNGHGQLTSIENSIGEEIRYQYNDMSVMEEARYYDTTNTTRRVEQYDYNWKSQLIEHNGNLYLYNAMGQVGTVILPPISPATVSDSTYLEYDPYGRLESVTEVVANSSTDRVTTEYAYDDHGNLTTVTGPEDNVYSFKYDDRGLLVEETSDERGTTIYRYDEAGNLKYRKDAEAIEVTFGFDAMNRLIEIDYPGDLDVTYTYDVASTNGMGRLSRESKTDNSIDYSYDDFGRLIRETHVIGESDTAITRYTYNKNDGILSVTYPSGVKYTYNWDSLGRVDSVTAQFGAGQIELIADVLGYEPFGGIDTILYANGIKTVINHENSHDYRVTGITTGNDDILRRKYTYDDAGNVAMITDSITAASSVSYDYNRQNRLKSRTVGAATIDFDYFANGNRKLRYSGTTAADSATYVYNTNNRLTGISYPYPEVGPGYGYDDNGNMTWEADGSDITTYDYDEENRLGLVTTAADTVAYGYSTRSQRQTLTSHGVTDTYVHGHNGLLLTEYQDGDWETDYIYLYGRPIARTTAVNDTIWPEEPDPDPDPPGGRMMGGGLPPLEEWRIETTYSMKWYHNDHLGTPQYLTRSNKDSAWVTGYLPFGQLESEVVAGVQENHRFPGQYHDRSTDLYYNQYRFYRPDLGRYMNPDPIGIRGGLNLYSYAGQNPINYTDPWGLERYKFYMSWGLGLSVTFGREKGRSFLEAGLMISWPSVGFQVQDPAGLPEHLQLEVDEKGALAAGYYLYEGVNLNIKNSPIGGQCGNYQYEGLAMALSDDDIARGQGRQENTIFPGGSPYVHHGGAVERVKYSWPMSKSWFAYSSLINVTLGISW